VIATLYLLARPQFTTAYRDFLAARNETWHEGPVSDAERLVEFAGRICYMSFGARQSPRDNAAYIANLIDQGHDSVLEHASWSFLLDGVSRSFTHQLVRHRIGFSFSQLSQQYHDHSRAEFLPPAGLERIPEALAAWNTAVEAAQVAYHTIQSLLGSENEPGLEGKEQLRAIRSASRSVLPNATETRIVVTANARSLRHFLSLRGATEGDFEMRHVSGLIYKMLQMEAPALVSDFENSAVGDDAPLITRRLRDV
jgi:thymidylate synthase (FAD)